MDPEGAIRGAAALAWIPRGFPLLVHVAPPWRRQGIGRALVQAAANTAVGETPALRAWTPLEETSEAAQFLRVVGFQVTRRVLAFETDGLRFSAAMTTLLARLRAAGKVPADVHVAHLAEASPADVVALVAPEFGTMPHDVAWRLAPGAPGAYDRDLSLVLLRGGAVCGAILCLRSGDLVTVDVNVVAPHLRRGWANLLLLEAITHRCRADGVTRCHFTCEEHVRDTLNVARRSDAIALPPRVMLTLPLGNETKGEAGSFRR